MERQIVIIGGGASGLAAALAAAEIAGGQRVTVLERLDRVGKKLLATGNGRCNITNRNAAPEHYQTADPARLARMLENVPPDAVLDFFAGLGLLCDTQPDGRVYPYCYQASMVLDVLRAALERAGVSLLCGQTVTGLRRGKNGLAAETGEGKTFPAARVILAAGGLAAPQFGTDGAGYALARAAGHTVRTPHPCLVPLRCAAFPAGLKGLRTNGALTLLDAGRTPQAELRTECGEIQFAEYGLSGIPAMQLSCLLPQAKKPEVAVDLLPQFAANEVRGMIEARCQSGNFPTLETLLLGLIGKKLGYAVMKACGLQPLSRTAKSLPAAGRDALAETLKHWRFAVTGTLPWAQAQATGGGVPLGEVDEACASRKCPGLYLTGEVLDAVGECGGFNLQWAWATGIAAGRAAGRAVTGET
ncbi:MAG: aminoacetone oxidase family FAD-binding enzyme [Subdoligranulum sp.]|nr:aminoacetone oxidase family FAD-binding enzyme [Subdoligranulum sp.]